MTRVWEEFKEKTEIGFSSRQLHDRFRHHIAPTIHSMDEFDLGTRIKLLYATKIPVNSDFLKEAREHEHIEVNQNFIITEIGSDFHFSSNSNSDDEHGSSRFHQSAERLGMTENNLELLNFLVDKVGMSPASLVMTDVWREYNRKRRSTERPGTTHRRFRKQIAGKIEKFEELDLTTKINILRATNTPISKKFLIEIRKLGVAEVDEKNIIVRYERNDFHQCLDAWENSNERGNTVKRNPVSYHVVPVVPVVQSKIPVVSCESKFNLTAKELEIHESDIQMLDFIVKKVNSNCKVYVLAELWRQYKAKTGSSSLEKSLQRKFREHIAKKIEKFGELSWKTKIRLLYATSTPVTDEFLTLMRRKGSVAVNEKNLIIQYVETDSTFKVGAIRNLTVKKMSNRVNPKQKNRERSQAEEEDLIFMGPDVIPPIKLMKIEPTCIQIEDVEVSEKNTGDHTESHCSQAATLENGNSNEGAVETHENEAYSNLILQLRQDESRHLNSGIAEEAPSHFIPDPREDEITFDSSNSDSEKDVVKTPFVPQQSETKSVLEILKSFKFSIPSFFPLESSQIHQRIDQELMKLEVEDSQIPVEKLAMIIRNEFNEVTTGLISSKEFSDSTSLKEFLGKFKIMILVLELPDNFESLLACINAKLHSLEEIDELVPTMKTRKAIGTILSTTVKWNL